MTEKPYKAVSMEKPEIPRKPKKTASTDATNGDSQANGQPEVSTDVQIEDGPKGVKRRNAGDDDQPTKKARMDGQQADGAVVVEDNSGAIVIDD
jgi:hypothetical protein